jgi:hypothetical protein
MVENFDPRYIDLDTVLVQYPLYDMTVSRYLDQSRIIIKAENENLELSPITTRAPDYIYFIISEQYKNFKFMYRRNSPPAMKDIISVDFIIGVCTMAHCFGNRSDEIQKTRTEIRAIDTDEATTENIRFFRKDKFWDYDDPRKRNPPDSHTLELIPKRWNVYARDSFKALMGAMIDSFALRQDEFTGIALETGILTCDDWLTKSETRLLEADINRFKKLAETREADIKNILASLS